MCMILNRNAYKNAQRIRTKCGKIIAYKLFCININQLCSPMQGNYVWKKGYNKDRIDKYLLRLGKYQTRKSYGFHVCKSREDAKRMGKLNCVIVPVTINRKDIICSGVWEVNREVKGYVVKALTIKKKDWEEAINEN